DISTVSNETLTELFSTAPILRSYQGTRGVNRRPCEVSILEFIARAGEKKESQSIPVPKVHRVLNIETEGVFFGCRCLVVMDFVKGTTLEECWDDLSQTEHLDVVSQLSSMITAQHSIPPLREQQQQPGPLGCKTPGSTADLNHSTLKQAPKDAPLFHFDRLVLRHLDIAPRNLILGPDGRVWLIDWADSGAFTEIRCARVH
ncbi:Aminoglycoside phosphotransferase, partial [Penicillium rubens]